MAGEGRVCGGMHAAGRALPNMAGLVRVCGGMHAAGRALPNMANLDAYAKACIRRDGRSLI
jgi:hypothetical protein